MGIRNFYHFLKASKADRRVNRRIVLGNESADLDSVVSALMMAYYQHLTDPLAPIPLPVVNIPRQEMRLRTDILFLMKRLNIDLTKLTFVDEIDLSNPANSQTFSLTLVDHNQLAPHQAHLNNHVTAIIDHHIETGRYDETVKKTIRPVGSTATLIGYLFIQNHPETLGRNLARFLLAPILVDTRLLKDPVKTTPLDQTTAKWLQTKAELNVTVFYDLLQGKKSMLSHLTAKEILKKDFKAWRWAGQTGGISSTPQLLETLLKTKPGILEAAHQLASEHQFDFYIIMGNGGTPQPRRDLVIWCPGKQLIEQLVRHLQKSTIGIKKALFSHHKTSISPHFHHFHQENPLFSRKKMTTELHSCFGVD